MSLLNGLVMAVFVVAIAGFRKWESKGSWASMLERRALVRTRTLLFSRESGGLLSMSRRRALAFPHSYAIDDSRPPDVSMD